MPHDTRWRREVRAGDPLGPVCSALSPQDLERQHAHIGIMVEFSIALMSKLDGINRHSFNSFRLRVGEGPELGQAGLGEGGGPCVLASPRSGLMGRFTVW